MEGDPTWCPSQTPVVVVEGRIVSTLRIWDRWVHLGSTPVRMGGIGGVTTHPDYRGRGIATRLMEHAAEYMRDDGYDLGLLFTMIPAGFYRRLGWSCVPLMGFHAKLSRPPQPGRSALEVLPFDESRDLEETVALYQRYNAGRSGSLLRPRPYWDYAPSRVRGVLPTAVVRDSAGLSGYINWESDDDGAEVYEVAYESGPDLDALVQHLLDECAAAGVTQIEGEIPHSHPFVDALVATADADLGTHGRQLDDGPALRPRRADRQGRARSGGIGSRTAGRSDVSAFVWRVLWPRLGTHPPRPRDLAGGWGGSST